MIYCSWKIEWKLLDTFETTCNISLKLAINAWHGFKRIGRKSLTTNFGTFVAVDATNSFRMSLDCWPGCSMLSNRRLFAMATTCDSLIWSMDSAEGPCWLVAKSPSPFWKQLFDYWAAAQNRLSLELSCDLLGGYNRRLNSFFHGFYGLSFICWLSFFLSFFS